jgi:hypothetical protein
MAVVPALPVRGLGGPQCRGHRGKIRLAAVDGCPGDSRLDPLADDANQLADGAGALLKVVGISCARGYCAGVGALVDADMAGIGKCAQSAAVHGTPSLPVTYPATFCVLAGMLPALLPMVSIMVTVLTIGILPVEMVSAIAVIRSPAAPQICETARNGAIAMSADDGHT